jgi:hypothetical protein
MLSTHMRWAELIMLYTHTTRQKRLGRQRLGHSSPVSRPAIKGFEPTSFSKSKQNINSIVKINESTLILM